MATDDLWGELPDVEEIKTPLVILKEQAGLLTEKTGGLLVGEVAQQDFKYSLDIIVPTLNNYSYNLLHVHSDMDIYPLMLYGGGSSVKCSDEDEFKKKLGKILKSQETQDVISKLLMHVRSAGYRLKPEQKFGV
jgi:hypothetical protein